MVLLNHGENKADAGRLATDVLPTAARIQHNSSREASSHNR